MTAVSLAPGSPQGTGEPDVNGQTDNEYRLLVADDNHVVHDYFRTVLGAKGINGIGESRIEIDGAFGGEQAVALVQEAVQQQRPYTLAFLDLRMGPGIDGVEAATRIWEIDPDIHLVICTAHSRYPWDETIPRLGRIDQLQILIKPLDMIVVRQLTSAIVKKWQLTRELQRRLKELEQQTEKFRMVIDTANDAYVATDQAGAIVGWSVKAEALFGWSSQEALGRRLSEFMQWEPGSQEEEFDFQRLAEVADDGKRAEMTGHHREGHYFPVETSVSAMRMQGQLILNCFVHDISDRMAMQSQLAHSQKMESVGQLAAGIAHEINTPIQYVADNVRFLQNSFCDLEKTLSLYDELRAACQDGPPPAELLQSIDQTAEDADLAFLREEIPNSIQESLQGAERVAHIVKAMKEFSHPGGHAKTTVDLNHAIDNTITVSRNEWKYVADLVTDFDPSLPDVTCLPSDFNQAILNLVVNAAHAIAEAAAAGKAEKGTITVSTKLIGDQVEVRVADTGPGIPRAAQAKIFDPFFTTKPVGKGTGQGLAIVYSVVVDKHGGAVSFETEEGVGTTFIIRIPVNP